MCGIFAYISSFPIVNGKAQLLKSINDNFGLGYRRGPESKKSIIINDKIFLGFHRLAINGLNEESNQPFVIDGVYLICNGEIYNYKDLFIKLQVTPTTQSDCEVIIWMYKKYGIEYTLQSLDGVFAFILYDSMNNRIYVGRDPYGVRPIYVLQNTNELIISSELKQLNGFYGDVKYYPPGSYSIYSYNFLIETKKYTSFPFLMETQKDVRQGIYNKLKEAVRKRTIGTTDRPIACLLSGGLDSSVITALVNELLPKGQLETYSIGLEGSVDLKYAKIVADYLGTKHTEIIISEDDFFNAIPEVIEAIESYDTTTVRASVGNYLIGKYISKNSEAKVIFNGDGSDELTGGYLYFNKCEDSIEFDKETKRLLTDIHMYDVLRSDKSISTNGLEPRTPFLDRGFVEYYLSILPEIRCHSLLGKCEKYLLRESIEFGNINLLPREILYRRKEAFSDGVSSENRSWYQIIQEKILFLDQHLEYSRYKINKPQTSEMCYYRNLFECYFPGRSDILKYFWMPKYVKASDPSARTLKEYSKE